ncbi:HAMP domain-containing sensor histidine kinase [Sphingobium aquiterrae]|uniref:sensor histidine kinase n=1 Tax=Sphingobium aquiterrae TaxID=2038656 RepID=UPI003016E1A6
MRFNDIMQTVLAAEGQGNGAVTLWRQCVDLLAQYDRPGRPPLDSQDREALLDRMGTLRERLSETQRIATVVELGSRLRSTTLLRFFAQDRPAICAAAMSRARLPESAWLALLPELGPTARGVLRGRRDLGEETRRALDSFGQVDLVLPMGDTAWQAMDTAPSDSPLLLDTPTAEAAWPQGASPEDGNQIRRLVDRIERFTATYRPQPMGVVDTGRDADADVDSGDAAAPLADMVPRTFAFETDAAGIVTWVGHGPRAALIGLSIAEPAATGGSGPDGNVAGAFARRSAFQNGRFIIAGGVLGGEWRMSAIPFFDPRSGRFQGFRGQARRPHLHEVPSTPPSSDILALGGLSADSVRQLVHELRTPLNAIMGFAEIIEQQLFGPAGNQYRDMARQIMGDARHLLAAFDDLDLAARVARGGEASSPKAIDPALMVARVAMRFREGRAEGATAIDIAMAPDLPAASADPAQAERMIQHLLRTLVSVCGEGEGLTGACAHRPGKDGGVIMLGIDRPAALAGIDEAQLLDPGYGEDGEWPDAPLLGLGFSLRLIRSLAASIGGTLDVTDDRLVLSMPAMAKSARDDESATP